MAKTEKIKPKDESKTSKKTTKKETQKTEKEIEKKEIPHTVKVLNALNNNFPRWTNGLDMEKDFSEEIHSIHLAAVLNKLVAEKMVDFDRPSFSYQITEYGKFYLNSVNI